VRNFINCANIIVDGDEYLKGFLGLDWMPSDESKENARRYEEWVVFELNTIMKRWSGWAVISEIFGRSSRGRKMYIRPYSPTPKDPYNAYASPLDARAATLKGAPQKIGGGPQAGKDVAGAAPGSGEGSDVEIRYTPWIFQSGIGGPGTNEPDEILLHEMVHGLREMSGVFFPGTKTRGFDTLEEFVAILVSNIYRSETGRPGLRADHSFSSMLSAQLSDPVKYAQEYYSDLSLMRGENENMFFKLGRLTAIPFNPVAQFGSGP
jgi:Effector protein